MISDEDILDTPFELKIDEMHLALLDLLQVLNN